MYFSIVLFLLILLFAVVLGTCRRRNAIQKVCELSHTQKCELLSSLIEPYGYCYDPAQDLISTLTDSWQRAVGYTALFDKSAVSFHMVFDCLPVYFPYQGKTWLIEFWKGQYGINTGAEIGVYYADRLLPKEEYSKARFHAVTDSEMLPLSFLLAKGASRLASIQKKTWWLTAFCTGRFSDPDQLSMHISLLFPDLEMRQSFLNALYELGIQASCLRCCCNEVQFCFGKLSSRNPSFPSALWRHMIQLQNRFFCKLYCHVTRYFCLTLDRLLYLYFLLPSAFRRVFRSRKYKGHSCPNQKHASHS